MGILAANMFLTLDGVYQAPGRRDEDREGAFEFGGWQEPYSDPESGEAIGEDLRRFDAVLLGRKTYDIFAQYWPTQRNWIADRLNSAPKFVVSRTLTDPTWQGTTVLPDAASAGRLRDQFEHVHTIGSGDLLRSLLREDLVDRLNLWLYPITLGAGKRVFAGGTIPASFRLVSSRAFPKGSVSLVYERAGDVELREMPDVV